MDLFSWIPIIIFIYAVSTIFSPNKKKPQNRRPPTTRPQGQQSDRTPYSRQETKPARSGWREMFEELERELFPKEEPIDRPSRPSPAPRYPSTPQSYGREGSERVEGFSTEGTWGTEGTAGVEGSVGSEGMWGSEGSFDRESAFSGKTGKESLGKPEGKPRYASAKPVEQEKPVFPAVSDNPLVQGIIWAEVLGKPRAYNKYAYNRRI
ncbi:hypothetical protein DesLBE_0452 [Desulfitobacterium sp. LBE]|uniref:hypothetical protein n=1 Tax=Desulfitobacterium sp. LBE TaxID=884086 RepID=UPI00119C87D5|nr:hypothetical protein [Desulfitobacterium sp. LBE]TWH56257.1 hypothetical protein DesLBE_0452 [Desulfitobacterium sp. LBE]